MLWVKFLLFIIVPVIAFVITIPMWRRGGQWGFRGSVLVVCIVLTLVGWIVVGNFGGGLGVCPNGSVAVETTWNGVPTGKVMDPGPYYVAPVIGGAHAVNLQLQARTKTIEAASSDQQDVTAKVTVNFRVKKEYALPLYKGYREAWLTDVLDPAIEYQSKYAAAQFTPLDLLQKRTDVGDKMLKGLKESDTLAPFEIVAVNVENVAFSDAYTKAIEDKMVAAQKALEAENKLKQVQQEAAQTVATATAEAQKIKIQADAIQAQGGSGYVTLQMIQKWDGKLPPTLIIGGANSSPFQILDVGQLVDK
ncbi:MAG: prohibitin family protein [Parcubacteria group bacterium]|jgi:regulator of protease activity HflC (stomatin/prohibitin superfamily)